MVQMTKQATQQLIELLHYLSMQLIIPLPKFQDDFQLTNQILLFAYQCLNKIMTNLMDDWKQVNQEHLERQKNTFSQTYWRAFINIVEECFLEQQSQRIGDGESVTLNDLIQVFGIICHGCQAIRQSSEDILKNKEIKQAQKLKKSKPKKKHKTEQHKNKSKQKAGFNIGKQLEKQILQNVQKTLKTRKKVANPKFTANIRDKEANAAVQKAKRVFDYTTNNIHKQNRKKKANQISQKIKSKKKNQFDTVDKSYLKYIQNKHKKLNEEVQSQQLRYYVELRDKKVAYIKHIHQLIEKLEKQRQIDFQKQKRQQQKQQRKKIEQKIIQVDQIFSHNMEQLKQNYQNKKKAKIHEHIQEINVCRQIEQSIKEKKKNELDNLKNLWEAQTKKLQLITGDEEKMKAKLIDIYRKNRV